MKINNINNTNFNGYKNVIHNDVSQDNIRFTFLSMQLNDNGVKDLAELRKIQQLQNLDTNNDVLSLFYSKKSGSKEFFYFNGNPLFLGGELRNLWELCSDRDAYKLEEKAALKAYTLIASLTKRMMNSGLPGTDNSFPHVVKSTMESFMKIFTSSPAGVFNLIQGSILENKQLEKTAAVLNSIVDKNMKIFLK